jgi:hypothetical protein
VATVAKTRRARFTSVSTVVQAEPAASGRLTRLRSVEVSRKGCTTPQATHVRAIPTMATRTRSAPALVGTKRFKPLIGLSLVRSGCSGFHDTFQPPCTETASSPPITAVAITGPAISASEPR